MLGLGNNGEISIVKKDSFKGFSWVPNRLLESREFLLLVFYFLIAYPLSLTVYTAHILPCLALSTLGLDSYPTPRVLFSAGEGKRCWLLSRDVCVDVRP